MPVEKLMDKLNSSNKIPLSFANNSVLKPANKNKAKISSAAVATVPMAGIIEAGIHGFINRVYSKKLPQFPQTETSLLHHPNLSATADTKPAEIANRKNSLTMIYFVFVIDISNVAQKYFEAKGAGKLEKNKDYFSK